MKQYIKYLILIALIAGIDVAAVCGQDSLSVYLEQAAINNPGVKARYLEYTAALEKAPQAASLPDPQLQFGYFVKPMALLGGNQVGQVSLMQMFPWFGTLRYAKDEASKMAMSKFDSFLDARNELYFNVKSSYFRIYKTMKEIEIANKNLDILNTLDQLALAKFRNGGASSSSAKPMTNSMTGSGKNEMADVLLVQIGINNLESRLALLKDQLTTDRISFNRFLNRPPYSEVFTVDSLVEMAVPADISTLNDSLLNHPMVKMYEAESEANAAKLDKVTRMGYPVVGLGLNYMIIRKREGNTATMNGNDMVMPMVSVSLPIYRRKYKAMRHESEFMRDAASMSAEDVTNNLRVNVQETIEKLNDAGRRVTLYDNQEALAVKSVQLLISSYSAGETELSEVLRMQQQLLDFQLKKVEAVVDKNTAVARIVYLSGN